MDESRSNAAGPGEPIVFAVNSDELVAAFAALKESGFSKEFPEVVKHLFGSVSKLARIEQGITVGAVAPILLKPSDRLLDFLAACRAIDGKRLAVARHD